MCKSIDITARLAIAALFVFSAFCTAGNPAELPKPELFHIFLLMGQSNMAGHGRPIPEAYTKPHPRVLCLNAAGTWEIAQTPLDPARKSWGGVSPGESFARAYADLFPDVTVGLVMCAKDGRKIEELMKGKPDRDKDYVYDSRMGNFLKVSGQGTVKGVLWHQGEANIKDPEYSRKLQELVADVRKDTGMPDLPWIAGELGHFADWTEPFNLALPGYYKPVANSAVASAEGLTDGGDKVHFSGESADIFGRRYLKAYLSVIGNNGNVPDTEAPKAAEGDTLLKNGDMSKGNTMPTFWENVSQWGDAVRVRRDTQIFHSEPASLCLEPEGEKGKGCVSQLFPGFSGKLKATGWCRMEGEPSNINVAVQLFDANYEPKQWITLCHMTEAGQWVYFEKEFTIDSAPAHIQFLLMIDGSGKAWLDDVALTKVE